MHWLITVIKLLFSNAATTRSLSANCLFTAASDECVPGVISTVTLNLGGSERNNLTRIDKPINVAMLQCGIVGVKLTNTSLCSLSTFIKLCWTTCSSSKVSGCSGSFMNRIKSKRESVICKYGTLLIALIDYCNMEYLDLPKTSRSSNGSYTLSSKSAAIRLRSSHFLYTFGLIFSISIFICISFWIFICA